MPQELTKEAFIKEWVGRLESGDYKQARGFLHDPEFGYCCLGVAAEIFVDHGIMGWYPHSKCYEFESYGYDTNLPPKLSQKYLPGPADRYVILNDEKGRTFKGIAAVIRREAGLPPASSQ